MIKFFAISLIYKMIGHITSKFQKSKSIHDFLPSKRF
nr:MAG TPA: hypothetical protein [Caudoviricetes sp.]